jgi:hypothetical protein
MRVFSSPACPRSFALRLILACCLFALATCCLQAQSTFGSILGTVRDVTGAVVPGAQVTLTNRGTTATRTQTSDATGNYTFNNVDVGSYSLTIAAAGFQTNSVSEFSLTARETRRVDATLQPGS